VRVLIQTVEGRRARLSEFRGLTLIIGRGTNATIRSDNPAVALEHAVIDRDVHGYSIADKGSVTGTYVNGQPIENERLKTGDVIVIGDLHIVVDVASSEKPLVLRMGHPQPEEESAGVETSTAAAPVTQRSSAPALKPPPDIDYSNSLRLKRPYLSTVILASLALVATAAFIGDITSPDAQLAFMPGGLSSTHASAVDASGQLVGTQCSDCHVPWKGAASEQCQSCHRLPPHSARAATGGDCISCHVEHRAERRVAAINDSTCVSCHSDTRPHLKPGVVATVATHITSFDNGHPDFRRPVDADTLRFNHHQHLDSSGLFDAQGKTEVLQCKSCHSMVAAAGRVDPAPIKFQQHCQRCHDLSFDAQYPGEQVPHGGDPRLVYGYVAAILARGPVMEAQSATDKRRIVSRDTSMNTATRVVMQAEHVIKMRCALCHQITTTGQRLSVTPPEFIHDWLSRSEFSHARHQPVACEQCHAQAAESESANDVLLPAKQSCVGCHGRKGMTRSGGGAMASSNCLTCHEYHHPTAIPNTRGVTGN
jgi:predicted CXXCH cytochrome family protein